MANRKIRDCVVKVGEYQDRNTGETKGRFENVGALMQNDEDQSYFIMLRRTFNPAGVPNSDGRDSILINCYLPKDQRQSPNDSQGNNQGQGQQPQGNTYAGASGSFDDDTPF